MDRKIVITTAVWGQSYIDDFLNFGIPSILSNSLKHEQDKIIFKVITSTQCINYFKLNVQKYVWAREQTFDFVISNAIDRLEKIEKITRLKFDKYPIHSHCFNMAIQDLEEKDILILNYADFIWGDQAIYKILKLLDNSEKDIITCHPLTCDDSNTKRIDKYRQHNDKLKIPSDEIMKISLTSAKWWYDQYRWGNSKSSDYLSILYWKISEEQYLFRGFHLQPIAFRKLSKKGVTLPPINFGTVDGHYLPQLIEQGWNAHFMSDPKEFSVGTFTNKSKSYYFQSEQNFHKRFIRHVLKSQNIHELNNLNNFLFIGEAPDDKEKYVRVSFENLEKTLTGLTVNRDFIDKKKLMTDLKFIENLEVTKTIQYIKFIIQFMILKISFRYMFIIILRSSMYMGRVHYVTHQNYLRNNYKSRIFKLRLIQSLQKFINYNFLIEENKINNMIREIRLIMNKSSFEINDKSIDKELISDIKGENRSSKINLKGSSIVSYLFNSLLATEIESHHIKKSRLYNESDG